jgi:hypothetical protein
MKTNKMNFKVKKISDQDKGKVYIISERRYIDKSDC